MSLMGEMGLKRDESLPRALNQRPLKTRCPPGCPSARGASVECGKLRMDALEGELVCTASSGGAGVLRCPLLVTCVTLVSSESPLSTAEVQLHKGRGVLVAGGRRWGLSGSGCSPRLVGPSVSALRVAS